MLMCSCSKIKFNDVNQRVSQTLQHDNAMHMPQNACLGGSRQCAISQIIVAVLKYRPKYSLAFSPTFEFRQNWLDNVITF